MRASRARLCVLALAASLGTVACKASLGAPCATCGGDTLAPGDGAGGDRATTDGTTGDGRAGDPPPAGDPDLVSSITRDGITWTFQAPTKAGQFVTGDWWVVGPVTVSAISPAPQTSAPFMNGSALNMPNAGRKSAFDQRLDDGVDESWWFDEALRVYPPLPLVAGDSLVSSVSLSTTEYHNVPELFGSSGDMSCSPVKSVSILTVLATPPAADAFRPSYCDRTQTLYYAGSLNRGLLPALAAPNATIATKMPALLTQFAELFRRPWTDITPFTFDTPADYMPSYAQRIALADSFAGLLMTLDFPAADKINLTNGFVQYGIDLYGCARAGVTWKAFGGHGSGRKMPIIVAGLLFGNDGMKNVSTAYPNAFGEDMQTVYINQIPGSYAAAWQGATVIYGGHYGVDDQTGLPVDTGSGGLYAPYEQLMPSAWPLTAPTGGYPLGEAYRRCCTSNSWIGEALAVRLLGGVTAWNHAAFFDYADRWMTEDDTQAVADILSQTGFDYSDWQQQRQTHLFLIGRTPAPTFVDDMWAAYR